MTRKSKKKNQNPENSLANENETTPSADMTETVAESVTEAEQNPRNNSSSTHKKKKKKKKKKNKKKRNSERKRKDTETTPAAEMKQAVSDALKDVEKKVPKKLPIEAVENEILAAVAENQVVIITGNTGCGKSTKIPQILYHAGYAKDGMIACTQPRRIAAWSLAERVAKEMKTKVGELVGYKVRFDEEWSETTKIMYLSDGSLVGACPDNLRLYSAIVVDEVHQRSITTDILLGLLKEKLSERKDLKLILSSATIDSTKFSRYFNDAPILHIEGSPFRVETFNIPVKEKKYFPEIVRILKEIDRKGLEGDVLVFLAGKNQILKVDRLIKQEESLRPFLVHAHAELSGRELREVFHKPPKGQRKVILATNIAETSLTIETIAFVIDSGYVNIIEHDGKNCENFMRTVQCSKAEALQRKGRCGRTQEGVCYQLFAEEGFLQENAIPEMRRLDLSSMILKLKSMHYTDVRKFDFLDLPDLTNLKSGHDNLHRLKALNKDCALTSLGRKMSSLPLEPNLAAALIKSSELGCAEEVVRICALMSSVTGYNIPKLSPLVVNNQKLEIPVGAEIQDIVDYEGETLALGQVLSEYFDLWENNEVDCRFWCHRNYLNDFRLDDAFNVYEELCYRMERLGLPVESCQFEDGVDIAEAFLEGFFHNLVMTSIDPKSALLLRNRRKIRIKNYLMSPVKPEECLIGCDVMNIDGGAHLLCLTRVPPEIDIKQYSKRCFHTCQHVQYPENSEPKKQVKKEENKSNGRNITSPLITDKDNQETNDEKQQNIKKKRAAKKKKTLRDVPFKQPMAVES